MTLSDVSIKNPVFAWMLMIGLIVFGWIGFHRMGISQLPDVDFPTLCQRMPGMGDQHQVIVPEWERLDLSLLDRESHQPEVDGIM